MKLLESPLKFEWDRGNSEKNLKSHGVTDQECEEVFFDPDKRILRDRLHSGREERYLVIGKTKKRRLLFVVFTRRQTKLRVISARDINKKEQHLYAEKT